MTQQYLSFRKKWKQVTLKMLATLTVILQPLPEAMPPPTPLLRGQSWAIKHRWAVTRPWREGDMKGDTYDVTWKESSA